MAYKAEKGYKLPLDDGLGGEGLILYPMFVTLSGGTKSDVAYPSGVNNVAAVLCDRANATPNNTDKNFDIASGSGSEVVFCILVVYPAIP